MCNKQSIIIVKMQEDQTILAYILDSLQQMSHSGSQSAEKFLTQCAQSGTFLDTCLRILSVHHISLNLRQQAASLIAKILIDSPHKLSDEYQANLMLKLMSNWRIVFDVKKMMITAINHMLILGEEGFQLAIKSLVDDILKNLSDLDVTFNCRQVQQNCKSKPYFQEMSETLLMLSSCLLHSVCQSNQQYLNELINNIKIFHCLFFNDGMLLCQYYPLLVKLFTFYQDLTGLAYENKQDFVQCLKEIAQWPFIYKSLQEIYKLEVASNQQNQHITNFITLSNHNQTLILLKIMVSEFHRQLITNKVINSKEENNNSIVCIIGTPQFAQSLHITIQSFSQSLTSIQISNDLQNYCLSLFSLYTCYIQMTSINFEQGISLVKAIVIPIMHHFFDKSRPLFQDDVYEFYRDIQDCCECQTLENFLTEACKLLQIIVSKCSQIYHFLVEYCKKYFQSIIKSQKSQKPDYETNKQKQQMNTCICILIIKLLEHSKDRNQQLQQVNLMIAVPQFFIKLNAIQMALFYFSLQISWCLLFEQMPEKGQFFLLQALNLNMNKSTRYFALCFLKQNFQLHFYQSFITVFFNTFNFLQIQDEPWVILSKTIQIYSEKFTEQCMCQLLQMLKINIRNSLKKCNEARLKNKHTESSFIVKYLNICWMIAKSYVRDNHKLILRKEIFEFLKLINELRVVNLDDEVLKIANQIFSYETELLEQFTTYLPYVNRSFMQNNYQGDIYYQFLDKYITSQGQYQDCLQNIANILLVSLHYHTDNLQINLPDNSFLCINNSLVLLQKIGLVSAKDVFQRNTQQILAACDQTLLTISKSTKKDTTDILTARIINLQIICRYRASMDIPFEKLIQNSRKAIFMDYDAYVLLHMLQKISLNPKQSHNCDKIITTILHLLRSSLKPFSCPNIQRSTNSKMFSNILKIIKITINTNRSFGCAAAFLLERYNFYDWNHIKSICPAIKVTDYKFILQSIEEAASKSLLSLTLPKKQQSNSATQIIDTRKIVKVVRLKKSLENDQQQHIDVINDWKRTFDNIQFSKGNVSYDQDFFIKDHSKRKREIRSRIKQSPHQRYTM